MINVYLNKKEEFLNNVFTNPTYLDDLTGLTDLKNKIEDNLVNIYYIGTLFNKYLIYNYFQIYEMNDINVEGLENNIEK